LILTIIRCPVDVPPERREVRGGEFCIGRGRESDWILQDADRHVSKRHCELVYCDGEWELHDLSTNGTYLNDSREPIGQGRCCQLQDRDRIKFGLYEIEVHIGQNSSGGSIDSPDLGFFAPAKEPFNGTTAPDHDVALDNAPVPSPRVQAIPSNWNLEPPTVGRADDVPPQPAPAAVERPVSDLRKQEPGPSPVAESSDRLLAAFLRGAGIEGTLPDPDGALERIGVAMRIAVSGLRQTLMTRARIKDEFRIEQTMVRQSRNNPLKFSLDDHDAMESLLGLGRRGGMPPEEAVVDAFKDLRLHELATISAMQAAVRVLVSQLEPEAIERKTTSSAVDRLHPAQRKARAWAAFVKQHGRITRALSDDFDSVFGKAFARAYEQAMESMADKAERSAWLGE
jgi:type VI secretion system protein ImpI/type VI secretion system protein